MRQYLALFRNRNFMFHWMAGAISNVGDFFNGLAVVKLLSENPDNLGLYMSIIMICKMLPGVVLAPLAGVLADRISRKGIMIVTDLIRAALVLALVFTDHPAALIALVGASAAVAAFYNPASSALLPNIVEKDQMVTAGSLSVLTQRMAMLLGNAAGAVVLSLVGPHNVFYIDAASFVVSALLLVGMAVPATLRVVTAESAHRSKFASLRADLKETFTFLRQAPPVRNLLGILGIAAIGDSALNVLLVTFFTVSLGMAAEHMGYVSALFGATSVLGALVIGAVGNRIAWRHLCSFGTVYIWFVMMGAIVAHSPIPSVAFFGMLGLGSGAINVAVQAATAELVPDHVRGRIFGAWNMINSLIYVVGVAVAGVLSDSLGPAITLGGFTTFYLIAGVFGFFAFRPKPAPAPAEQVTQMITD